MTLLFALAQLLTAALAFGGVVRLPLVGQLGGTSQTVAVSGTTAYLGIGPRLVAMDVSVPGNIRRLGESVVLDGVVTDIALAGHYAYVTDGRGLKVIDVAEPAAPRLVASALRDLGATSVAVDGGLAIVATSDEILVVDLARPEVPAMTARVEVLGYGPRDVALADRRGYVVGRSSVSILDLSSPSTPRWVGAVSTTGTAETVAARGGIAYVGTIDAGLRVINAADPATAHEVGFWEEGARYISSIELVGRYAMLTDASGVRTLDVSSPSAPREISPPRFVDGATDVAVAGTLAIVTSNAGLEAFDITDIQNPRPVGGLDWPMFLTSVHVAGRLALAGDNQGQVHVLNVADPAQPVVLGRTRLPGEGVRVGRIITDGVKAFVAANNGLWILDVSAPAAPHEVAHIEGSSGLAVGGGHAFITDGAGGLSVLDVTTAVTPTTVGRLPGVQGGLRYADGHVYAQDVDGALQVIDVADPTRPRVVGTLAGEFHAFDVADGYAYLADPDSLRVIDVRHPEALRSVAQIPLPGWALSLSLAGNYAYFTDNSHTLGLVDVADPSTPVLAGGWTAPDPHLLTAAAAGDYVYLANAAGGLAVLRRTEGLRIYLPAVATGRSGTPHFTTTLSVPPRPKVSGWNISSALVGGTTKLPGVVARAM